MPESCVARECQQLILNIKKVYLLSRIEVNTLLDSHLLSLLNSRKEPCLSSRLAEACGLSTRAISTLALLVAGEPDAETIGSAILVDWGSARRSVSVACLNEPSLAKPDNTTN